MGTSQHMMASPDLNAPSLAHFSHHQMTPLMHPSSHSQMHVQQQQLQQQQQQQHAEQHMTGLPQDDQELDVYGMSRPEWTSLMTQMRQLGRDEITFNARTEPRQV